MNDLQKQILNIIQAQYPIKSKPFAALADQLDCSETEIIKQINQLKQNGIIRRLGAVFNAAHLGYISTLVAAQVPAKILDDFVADVNAMPGVSHNYGRNHIYNVWFTLTAPSQKSIDRTIDRLRNDYKIPAIYSLPAEKLFKIKVNFDFNPKSQNHKSNDYKVQTRPILKPSLTDQQIALIRQLQEDLPVVPKPFDVIAEQINISVDSILDQINQWKETGLIRRFGARIRHQQAGFTANGMVVFEIDQQKIDEVGALLAQYNQVSHCYHRPTAPDWPYNLFAMTHCKSDSQLHDLVKQMVDRIKPKQYDVLLSTAEYKKTNVKYFVE